MNEEVRVMAKVLGQAHELPVVLPKIPGWKDVGFRIPKADERYRSPDNFTTIEVCIYCRKREHFILEPEMPPVGTTYFTIEIRRAFGHFIIAEYINDNNESNIRCWENNNYFLTYDEAEKVVDKFNEILIERKNEHRNKRKKKENDKMNEEVRVMVKVEGPHYELPVVLPKIPGWKDVGFRIPKAGERYRIPYDVTKIMSCFRYCNEERFILEPEMPPVGTTYYTIETAIEQDTNAFTIVKYTNREDWFDKRCWETGIYFLTYDEAKKVVEKFNKILREN